LFYGGQAGGGKTDLLLGLAATQQQESIIFRREYKQLSAIIRRARKIYRAFASERRGGEEWAFRDGRHLELGAVQHPGDEIGFVGRAHDFKGFDEICHFLFMQFAYLTGWLRSTTVGQRVRIVCTGNPPTTVEGEWVLDYWGPWLRSNHPHPAQPGELRYFVKYDDTADGEWEEDRKSVV
jgi:hypothetical protein